MPTPREPTSDPDLEAEIDALIEDHGGAREVIKALLHDLDAFARDLVTLAREGDAASSRGYLRRHFSDGLRLGRRGG